MSFTDDELARLRLLHEVWSADIASDGYSFVGVFPTEPGDYHFAYTIGLDPALIVTGVSRSAGGLLDFAVEQDKQIWADGETFHSDDGDSYAFAPVPSETFDEICGPAKLFGATRARQLVWQDNQGLWPWERGPGSPTLCGDDWRPTR